MDRKELIAKAKELGANQPHKMKSEDLKAFIKNSEMEAAGETLIQSADVGELSVGENDTVTTHDLTLESGEQVTLTVVEPPEMPIGEDDAKPRSSRRRSPKERDAEGRVIRKGRNLSGNAPWRRKFYYLNPVAYANAKGKVDKAPGQVRIILRTMMEHGITSNGEAEQGVTVVDIAKDDGMRTSIGSANLFAYYRRTMEDLGLVHADLDEDGEPEVTEDVTSEDQDDETEEDGGEE